MLCIEQYSTIQTHTAYKTTIWKIFM